MRRTPDPAALERRATRPPVGDNKPIVRPPAQPPHGEPKGSLMHTWQQRIGAEAEQRQVADEAEQKAMAFAARIRARLAEMDVQLAEALAESGRFSAEVWLKAFQEEDRRS